MAYAFLIIKGIRIANVNCECIINGDRAAIVHKSKSAFQPIDYEWVVPLVQCPAYATVCGSPGGGCSGVSGQEGKIARKTATKDDIKLITSLG